MSQPDPKKRRIDAGSTIRSLHPELKAPGSSLSQPNYPAELRVPSPSSSSSIAPPPFFQQPSAPVYRSEGRLLGRGTFGAVYHASVAGPVPHHVAIKAVKHRDGDGNVEMAILRELRGSPNIVALLGCFVTGSGEEKRLNLVLEYLSDNLLRIIRHCRQLGRWLNVIDVSLYMHQLLRGLGVLQREAIVHRDLKPANLLVDSSTKILKICDFGTAKQLEPKREDGRGSDNRPYICSRYYRAPELILSAPHYGTAVDLWSAGCILAELLINQPLFTGEDGVSQLVAIMEILGTPSRHELYAMNPHYDESSTFRKHLDPLPLDEVLGRQVAPEVLELLANLLQYDPSQRVRPMDGLAASLFDSLWSMASKFSPRIFDLKQDELSVCTKPASMATMTKRINAFTAVTTASR